MSIQRYKGTLKWITFEAKKKLYIKFTKDEKTVNMNVPEGYGVEVLESCPESIKGNVLQLLVCE